MQGELREAALSTREGTQTPPAEFRFRRASFVEGAWIALADGQEWSLPLRPSQPSDPEYDALLRVVIESEDLAERRRGELAVAIFLLARNYELAPDDFARVLSARTGSAALVELQLRLATFIREQIRALCRDSFTSRGP